MPKKSTTNLLFETLVKASIFLLLLLGLALIVFGKEFGMRKEAQKTQERLVDSFIYVAKNWDEFNYSYRYGGSDNCSVPYEKVETCGIAVDLPQDLSGFSKDVVPAMGDPKYIMYWDSYDNVESDAWTGWFWLDVALWVIPESKILEGLKISGKVVFKVIPGAGIAIKGAKTLGRGVVRFGKLMKFTVEKLAKGPKIVLGEVEKEGSEVTLKYLIAGDKDAAYNMMKKGFEELAEKSSSERERKIFEEAAKQIEEQEKIIKEQLENTGNVLVKMRRKGEISISFPREKDELKGIEYLRKFGNLPGDKANGLRELILQGKLRICAPAGVLGGLLLDEFKNKGIITEKNENYYYKDKQIEQEIIWIGGLTFANGILKMRALKKGENDFELKTVDLVDMRNPDKNKWVFYGYKYDNEGNLVQIKLGTLKDIEQNRMFKIKSLGTCLVGAGITFALTDFVHTYEAKYETVKGEADKCKGAICLKGQSMYPKSYKAKELRKVFEENKICGIKLLNVDRRLERYTPNTPLGSADIANFYLASPCFAYAQIWVADCKNPENTCTDDNLCDPWYSESGKCDDYDGTPCCKRCIWVSLMKGKMLKFRENSAFNYCAWSPLARSTSIVQTPPWPWAGYWDICPRFFGLENILPSNYLCKLGEQMMMG